MRSMTWKFAVMAITAAAITACGGGGGGGNAPSEVADAPLDMSVDGVAAKGLMQGARVTAHAVGENGVPRDAVLASTTTGADGRYTLAFRAPSGRPLVLRVTAEEGTTHLDEVTGAAQPLPRGFSMRSLVTPAERVRAVVTPFSEMAVAAAERLPGGLSSDNATRARSTVGQLLGFDPTMVEVRRTTDAASTPAEQKLAIMLAAVSQLAQDGGLGCTAGSAADKTRCVVETLAGAARADTLKLEGPTDVSSGLRNALQKVLDNPGVAGNVAAPLLASVISNLECSGSACVPASPNAGGVPAAIAAAKALFTELKSDFTALFGAGTSGDGDLGSEIDKFRSALDAVQVPAEMMVKDVGALLVGVELYNDYKAGRTSSNTRGIGSGQVSNDEGLTGRAVVCQLFTDTSFGTPASAASNANAIFCAANYYLIGQNRTTFRHGFRLVPASNGAFTYSVRTESRQNLPPAPGQTFSGFFNGTIASGTDAAGQLTSLSVSGQLPPAYAMGTNTVLPGSFDWNVSAARTVAATSPQTSTTTFSGQVVSRDAQGATNGTLQVASGHLALVAGELGPAGLDVSWTSPANAFNGRISLSDFRANAAADRVPTRVVLEGALRNVAGATTTEFISGRLAATVSGWQQYDPNRPDSATNFHALNLSFQGAVTAPGRPVLQASLGALRRSHEQEVALGSLQYRSLLNGAPRMAVNITRYRDASGAWVMDVSESSSSLSMRLFDDGRPTDLLFNDAARIGELRNGVVTFRDGSVMSADLGF